MTLPRYDLGNSFDDAHAAAEDVTIPRIRKTSTFQAIALELSSGLALEETLKRIAAHAVNLLKASGAAVFLNQPDGEIELSAVYQAPDMNKGTRLKLGQGVAGQVAATRQPLVVDDYSNWAGAVEAADSEDIKAVIAVPLLYQEQLVGVLSLFDKQTGRVFTPEDLTVLQIIAPQAALAVVNAELYSRVYQLSQRLSVLLVAGLEITAQANDRPATLTLICERITTLFECDVCAVWLWNTAQKKLFAAERRSIENVPSETELAAEEALAKRAIAQSRPLLDGTSKAELAHKNPNRVAIPMYWHMQPVGVLVAAHIKGQARFEQDDIDLLSVFSQSVSAIIMNSELFNTLQGERDRLETVLTSTMDPILVIDQELKLLMVNPVAESNLKAQVGQDIIELFGPRMISPETVETLSAAFADGHSFAFTIRQDRAVYSGRAAPLKQREKGWVLTLRDVTHLKEVEELRSRMIHMMSHDLKNPLTGIMGLTQMLARKSDNLTPRQQDYVSSISANAVRMEELINAVLDLERAEAGVKNAQAVEISWLLRRLVSEFEPQAKASSQELTLKAPEEALVLHVDETQIYQALSNLVSNALKYTPEGGKISIEARQQVNRLHIAVADTGYGIPKELQSKLFERFYKPRTLKTAGIPGTGLGLSLVKAVVEAHGGSVWAASEEDKGSTFHVELPIEEPNEATNASSEK